jgi:Bardet-Biedl syndrome 4 protein
MSSVPMSLTLKKPSFLSSAINAQDKLNWIANILFLRQDFDDCLKIVDQMLQETSGRHEFANYLKALILRIKGKIHESLELFKKCHMLNPNNADYLK